jgi:cytochrome P450
VTVAKPRVLGFHPGDPRFIADPYPALSVLREATPIAYDESLRRWFVTRHADVRACLRDRRLGRNFRHLGSEKEFHAEPLDPRFPDFWASERWSLLWLEPPEHTRIRKLVAAAFTPRAVESMRAPASRLARSLLENLGDTFDLLYDYAQPYSITLICELLGVPTDRHRDLLDWSHAIVKMYEFETTDEQAVAADEAARDFRAYVLGLIEERRAEPRNDMVSGLVEARVDGERLSDDQIVSTVIVLLNAGHEATVNTVGNGFRALAAHPGEWRRLVSGEVDPAQAIEELIRWDPPLHLFERWVLEHGVEVGGEPVPRGEKLALLFGSANRDPRVFPDPDRLDLGRANAAEHIGFGGGIHVCIGAPLARIELAASFEALAKFCPTLHLVDQPERVPTFVIRGFQSVQVAR